MLSALVTSRRSEVVKVLAVDTSNSSCAIARLLCRCAGITRCAAALSNRRQVRMINKRLRWPGELILLHPLSVQYWMRIVRQRNSAGNVSSNWQNQQYTQTYITGWGKRGPASICMIKQLGERDPLFWDARALGWRSDRLWREANLIVIYLHSVNIYMLM